MPPAAITLGSGPLAAVDTTYGTASPTPTSFTVSATFLTGTPGNLTVTPPTGYEVSLSSGSGYSTTSLSVPYTSATLASTTVYVRLTASATVAGSPYSGDITVSGGGASISPTIATVSSTVSKATPTATLEVTNSPTTYDGSAKAATVGIVSSSVAGTVQNILTGGEADQTNADTYAVTADFVPTDTANYNTLFSVSVGNFVINKATPTATLAVTNSPVQYDASPKAATVEITVSSVAGSVANILTGGAATQTFASTYEVTADFVPDDAVNYETLTALPAGDFVIESSANVTLSGPLAAVDTTYGTASASPTSFTMSGSGLVGAPDSLTVTPPSGYEVSLSIGSGYTTSLSVPYVSSTLDSTTVYVRLAASTGAGTYAGDIAVSGSASDTIATASSSVSAAPLTITAAGDSKTYGEVETYGSGSTAFTSGAGQLKNGDIVSSVTITDTDSGGLATAAAGGSYSLTPSAAVFGSGSAANYDITYSPGTLTVNKATPTVTVTVGSYTYSGSAQGPDSYNTDPTGYIGTATWIYAGTANDNSSYGPSPTPPTAAGSYTATVSLDGDDNFNPASSSATAFTIARADRTVTVTGSSSYVYDGTAKGPTTYTANPAGYAGAATWSYVGTGGTTYPESSTRPTEAGTYTAAVSLAADDNFNAAGSSAFPFEIVVDDTAPSPAPTFAVAPYPSDTGVISMTATTATDALSGPVEYIFENTTNGNNSGWSTSRTWSNSGLTAGETYSYRVRAKDAIGNMTAWSPTAYTLAKTFTTVFYDDFESPIASTTYTIANTSQQIDTAKWVRATNGFGADKNGIVSESRAGELIVVDGGAQAWAGRYTSNSGVTTASGTIGSLGAGQTIIVSFDAAIDVYNGGSAINANLVLFDGAGTRTSTQGVLDNTFAGLANLTGTATSTWTTYSFRYTVGDPVIDNNGGTSGGSTGYLSSFEGKDIAVRFKHSNGALVDNVRVHAPHGPVDHFTISTISSPQTVGTPITGITITARDASNAQAASFNGSVTFGGSGGFSGTSGTFVNGVLTGVSVTPTAAGSDLTLTVDDGAGHTGEATFTVQTQYQAWLTANSKTDTPANLNEYAFGTTHTGALELDAGGTAIVTRGQAPIIQTTVGSSTVTLTYARRKNSGCSFSAEYSPDLSTWLPSTDPSLIYPPGAPAGETVVDNGDDMEIVSIPFPIFRNTGSGYVKVEQNFCRIAVTTN